jgi:hypothetical protein
VDGELAGADAATSGTWPVNLTGLTGGQHLITATAAVDGTTSSPSGAIVLTVYDGAAGPLLLRMTTKPDAVRQSLLQRTAQALDDAGFTAKASAIYFLAAHNEQASRLNWAQALYNCTAIGAPSFVADRGWKSAGTSHYLSTGFNPDDDGTKVQSDSAAIAAWQADVSPSLSSMLAGNESLYLRLGDSVSPDYNNGACVSTVEGSTASVQAVGLVTASRLDGAQFKQFRGETLIATVTAAGMSPADGVIRICSADGVASPASSTRVGFVYVGEGLTDAEVGSLQLIVRDYMAAVGAPV